MQVLLLSAGGYVSYQQEVGCTGRKGWLVVVIRERAIPVHPIVADYSGAGSDVKDIQKANNTIQVDVNRNTRNEIPTLSARGATRERQGEAGCAGARNV
jgi:hypothetical protein